MATTQTHLVFLMAGAVPGGTAEQLAEEANLVGASSISLVHTSGKEATEETRHVVWPSEKLGGWRPGGSGPLMETHKRLHAMNLLTSLRPHGLRVELVEVPDMNPSPHGGTFRDVVEGIVGRHGGRLHVVGTEGTEEMAGFLKFASTMANWWEFFEGRTV